MIGCYCRVTTEDQNLDRQVSATSEDAREQIGAELADIETYRDKSTGTDTSRFGYRSLMADVEAAEIESVPTRRTHTRTPFSVYSEYLPSLKRRWLSSGPARESPLVGTKMAIMGGRRWGSKRKMGI